MMRRAKYLELMAAAAALLLAATGPALGAGFGIFEQGSKGMGMAGAFTAQVDDGSAMWHNVGGLGFLKEPGFEAGVTLIYAAESTFEGLDPFPGAGTTGEQENSLFYPPHVYYVRPLSSDMTFGFAFNAPFGLKTDWKEPWVGRWISSVAELHAFDFNPSLGWQEGPNLGLGFGAIVRFSDVSLSRYLPAVNPFTQSVIDVATVDLDSDFDHGYGWNVGVLHKITNRISWGLSYRSEVEIDYGGDGRFTQISSGDPVFDAVVATTIPFGSDLPVTTGITFPAMASLGLAVQLSRNALVEVDLNWTGWSSVDELLIDFPTNPEFSSVIPEGYEDCYNYRIGLRLDVGPNQWRFGYVFDETPQPEWNVGPLLPDADRNGFTIGFGWGQRLDLAVMYLPIDKRTTLTNQDGFFGTYDTTAWLFGATVKF